MRSAETSEAIASGRTNTEHEAMTATQDDIVAPATNE